MARTSVQILKQIRNIRLMVIGSITKRKDGHFNLNTYEYCPKSGKKRTHTRYLAAADRPTVDKLIAAGDRFCELMETYAELILAKTKRECLVPQNQSKDNSTSQKSMPQRPQQSPTTPAAPTTTKRTDHQCENTLKPTHAPPMPPRPAPQKNWTQSIGPDLEWLGFCTCRAFGY